MRGRKLAYVGMMLGVYGILGAGAIIGLGAIIMVWGSLALVSEIVRAFSP